MRLESREPGPIPAFASSFLSPHAFPCISPPTRFSCTAGASAVVARARLPGHVRPIVPAKPLHRFVEDKAQTRGDVVRAISAYVKKHNLQDAKDRRTFYCDDVLKSVLGVEKCTFLQVMKHVGPHLMKPEQLGGRYIEEASAIEQAFLADSRLQGESRRKNRRKSQARKKGAMADKEAGRHLYRTMILSDELAAVCRASEMQRHEVIKAVWNYIRMNNLKGQGPPENPIKCDFLLRKVFDADYINVRTVMSGVSPHIRKKE